MVFIFERHTEMSYYNVMDSVAEKIDSTRKAL